MNSLHLSHHDHYLCAHGDTGVTERVILHTRLLTEWSKWNTKTHILCANPISPSLCCFSRILTSWTNFLPLPRILVYSYLQPILFPKWISKCTVPISAWYRFSRTLYLLSGTVMPWWFISGSMQSAALTHLWTSLRFSPLWVINRYRETLMKLYHELIERSWCKRSRRHTGLPHLLR